MGKVLVLYDTGTGHTKKMAEYVAKGAKKFPVEVRLKSVDEATKEDILWCDGIVVGSPTYLGAVSHKMKKFWDDMTSLWEEIDKKIGCAFASSGGLVIQQHVDFLAIHTYNS